MEITGKVIALLPMASGVSKSSGKEWQSQDFVLEYYTDDEQQYPKRACINIFGGERITACNVQVGETLTAYFDIMADEWNGRWFNKNKCWKIERKAENVAYKAQTEAEGTNTANTPNAAYRRK